MNECLFTQWLIVTARHSLSAAPFISDYSLGATIKVLLDCALKI